MEFDLSEFEAPLLEFKRKRLQLEKAEQNGLEELKSYQSQFGSFQAFEQEAKRVVQQLEDKIVSINAIVTRWRAAGEVEVPIVQFPFKADLLGFKGPLKEFVEGERSLKQLLGQPSNEEIKFPKVYGRSPPPLTVEEKEMVDADRFVHRSPPDVCGYLSDTRFMHTSVELRELYNRVPTPLHAEIVVYVFKLSKAVIYYRYGGRVVRGYTELIRLLQ